MKITSCDCFKEQEKKAYKNGIILQQFNDDGYPVIYEKWQQNNCFALGGYRPKIIKYCPICGKKIEVTNED